MSATGISLFLFLFLGLAFYSCGAPSQRKVSKERISSLFLNMLFVCDDDPTLLQLVLETKISYAKEHFGDAEESREVTIRGVEVLNNYQKIPLQKFVSKAYKQLVIYHSIFQDIHLQWKQSQEEKESVVKNMRAIVSKIAKLKTYMGTAVSFIHRSLPDVKQFDTKTIWTKSAVQQKTWILGVLQEFKQSMLYMQSAFRMHAKQ